MMSKVDNEPSLVDRGMITALDVLAHHRRTVVITSVLLAATTIVNTPTEILAAGPTATPTPRLLPLPTPSPTPTPLEYLPSFLPKSPEHAAATAIESAARTVIPVGLTPDGEINPNNIIGYGLFGGIASLVLAAIPYTREFLAVYGRKRNGIDNDTAQRYFISGFKATIGAGITAGEFLLFTQNLLREKTLSHAASSVPALIDTIRKGQFENIMPELAPITFALLTLILTAKGYLNFHRAFRGHRVSLDRIT